MRDVQPAKKVDPRDAVRAEDLNVAPALLGAPLARPGRRLAAISIDVLVVGVLSNAGNVWLLAGLAVLVLLHLRRRERADPPARIAIAVLAAAALLAFGAREAWVSRGDDKRPAVAEADEQPITALPQVLAVARVAELEAQLARARKPFDPAEQIDRWIDDVGLGLGWAIAYFTLLPVWWNGQTLGKRLLGLRAVELTGKPMTVLRAFKRYGGYAAGMATGGFGFAQVLWDPNRQAIQDKTAHTVVIDLRRKLDRVDRPSATPEEPQ